MESTAPRPPLSHPRPKHGGRPASFGVESLESTISSLRNTTPQSPRTQSTKQHPSRPRSKRSTEDMSKSTISVGSSRDVSPFEQLSSRASQTTLSQPLTPMFDHSPAPESIASSAHSRRGSDLESVLSEMASQAILSSGEDDTEILPEVVDEKAAPQLVMPSIQMPSRRPFTEKGKTLGRLKVLVAGDSGEYHQVHNISLLRWFRYWQDLPC
jgi:hypothetical protein